MGNVRVKMNPAGARAVLQSAEVLTNLVSRAQAVANTAGEGFEASGKVGSGRARAIVGTTTFESRRAQAKNNALLKALDAGR